MVIGNINVSDTGYWLTDSDGVLSEGTADNYNVAYDASSNTLTLNNATIVSNNYEGYAIGVNSQKAIDFKINISGDNKISASDIGLYVRSTNSNSTLNIDGNGSLTVDAFQNAIRVESNASDATLNITNINLNTSASGYFEDLKVLSGANASSNLIMDGSNFTTSSNNAILLDWPSVATEGKPTFTLNNNARINVLGEGGIVYDYKNELIPSSGSNGIIKEGNNTIYYGEHEVNKPNPVIDNSQ